MIALGIHPAVVAPPPAPGNRQGAFAANPDGKAGASGAPGAVAGSQRGTGNKASLHGVPSGLQVGDPNASPSKSVNPQLLAKATPPPSVPRGATSPKQANELERKVFGDRPFYSMTLNMPNLNSAGGSWILRFAELNDSASTADLSAPRALHKVDPAYPLELMRQNVSGTVAVRAVIRADGSVSDVAVLRSVDERLDHYACEALRHWQFEPATRSGTPVDLAVVVMIPFHPVARPHF
jgi:TonB family protein